MGRKNLSVLVLASQAACDLNTYGNEITKASAISAVGESTSVEPTGGTDAATSNSSPPTTSGTSGFATTGAVLTTTGTATEQLGDTSTGVAMTDTGATTVEPSGLCGDGIVDADEVCDDGNLDDHDACTNDCLENLCGNNAVDEGEACDDGNRDGGDICSPTCTPVMITDISMGVRHTCALFADGKVRCWGQNEHGELCNGKTEDLGDQPDELPVADIVLTQTVKQIASGGLHTCARLLTDNVVCWGYGPGGQLGYPALDSKCDTADEIPANQVNFDGSAIDIAAGGQHTCVIVTDQSVKCWGYSSAGQLGNNKVGIQQTAVAVLGVAGATKLAAGAQHTCALLADKTIKCWGHNLYGQLGIGKTENIGDSNGDVPTVVFGVSSAKDIAAGGFHNCAILENEEVKCWGRNSYGQLGRATSGTPIGDQENEQLISVNLGAPTKALALGYQYSCALLDGGAVKCWGYGANGSLGYGNSDTIDQPGEFTALQPVELGGPAIALSASRSFDDFNQGWSTCAILDELSVRCWGVNDYGQLGLGHRITIGVNETPIAAGLVPY